jgi:AcrR family transcriptional regulator
LRGSKGAHTRAAILEAGLAIAQREGLEGLTIGALAEALGMSKSGVFAHFGAREELQRAVLDTYATRFIEAVLRPAVALPRGLPRLRAILEHWFDHFARELEAGCLLVGSASEYDDRPGALHDAVVAIVSGWKAEILRALEQACEAGHLAPDTDCEQLVFEIYGLMLMLHQDSRLLHGRDSLARARAGVNRLLAVATMASAAAPPAAAPPVAPPGAKLRTKSGAKPGAKPRTTPRAKSHGERHAPL